MGRMIQAGPRLASSGGGSGTALIAEYLLTAPTTNISNPSTASAGQSLVVFLTQDGTGGRAVTFDPEFKLVSRFQPYDLADSVAVLLFTGRSDGFWWLTSASVNGELP